jgi:hypothetical protein
VPVDHSRERHVLDIYVTTSCFGSDRARELADRVRAWRVPGVSVQVHDLADPGVVRPESVFAVPAFVIDGRLVSLGTPDEAWLHQLVTSE